MSAAVSLDQPASASPVEGEKRFVLHGVSWKDYVLMRDILDGPSPRMTYLEGVLELMSPSKDHEQWTKQLARLIEHYAYMANIELRGYRSTTLKNESVERGAEPDECYVVGRKMDEIPDFAIEVVHRSPLLDKLRVYAGLRVPEVWVFRDGQLVIHGLDSTGRYEVRERSVFLPALDPTLLARLVMIDEPRVALRELEEAVRGA